MGRNNWSVLTTTLGIGVTNKGGTGKGRGNQGVVGIFEYEECFFAGPFLINLKDCIAYVNFFITLA